ncbi:hypothetical protein Hanom_Chr03g00188351 [Helianthus anomalus]
MIGCDSRDGCPHPPLEHSEFQSLTRFIYVFNNNTYNFDGLNISTLIKVMKYYLFQLTRIQVLL